MTDEQTSLQRGCGTDRTQARSARERTDHPPVDGKRRRPRRHRCRPARDLDRQPIYARQVVPYPGRHPSSSPRSTGRRHHRNAPRRQSGRRTAARRHHRPQLRRLGPQQLRSRIQPHGAVNAPRRSEHRNEDRQRPPDGDRDAVAAHGGHRSRPVERRPTEQKQRPQAGCGRWSSDRVHLFPAASVNVRSTHTVEALGAK